MRSLVSSLSLAALVAATTAGAAELPAVPRLRPARAEVEQLRGLAEGVLGLRLGTIVQSGAAANVAGLRTANVSLSRRLDSHTYFAEDLSYGADKKAGVFEGPDEEMLARSAAILDGLKIRRDEIRDLVALQEHTQAGFFNDQTGRLEAQEVRQGRRYAEASRAVAGVPVFSSRAVVGLTRAGGVGLMEVHWPQIADETVREALHLQEIVKQGWRPPDQPGAQVESVEAGIIHSAAVGFVMDVYPVIRVIYAPTDSRMGRKAALYLDEKGESVPQPRQFEKSDEAPLPPREEFKAQ
jgi:hypothetical protein